MAIIVPVNIATNNVCSSMSQPQIVKWVPSELENGLATIGGTLVSKQLVTVVTMLDAMIIAGQCKLNKP